MSERLTIVGGGRVGQVVRRCAEIVAMPVCVLGRGDAIEGQGPLVVCTRADDLEAVIAATPLALRHRLCFVQNGLLHPLLARHGLERCTQGVLYFAATDRSGAAQPGGDSVFYGPDAGVLVKLLTGAGLPARALDGHAHLRRELAFKLGWNVIFGLLGQRFGETVGESAQRGPVVEALVFELAPVLALAHDTSVEPSELLRHLLHYSMGIPAFRATVKELNWRNGAVRTVARGASLPTPHHDRLLAELGLC